jgi:hypothetical protein
MDRSLGLVGVLACSLAVSPMRQSLAIWTGRSFRCRAALRQLRAWPVRTSRFQEYAIGEQYTGIVRQHLHNVLLVKYTLACLRVLLTGSGLVIHLSIGGFMRRIVLFLMCLAFSGAVSAGIYKLAVPSDCGLKLYWWPIVTMIGGWEQDEVASCANSINALVPKGQTFRDAPAVIYAKALYKPRTPETKSLEQFIREDIARFKRDFPGIVIEQLASINDGDGQSLPYYSFALQNAGNWDLVAYGEEGDFYLVFTLSGNSKAARDAARGDFERLVSQYKEHL